MWRSTSRCSWKWAGGLEPQGGDAGGVEGGEVEVAGDGEPLHGLEAAAVGGGPAPQRGLGVDATGAGDHDRGGQQLSEIGLEVVAALAEAADRDVDAVERLVEVTGIEPDRRRLAEQLVGVEERRQSGRDAFDDRRRRPSPPS